MQLLYISVRLFEIALHVVQTICRQIYTNLDPVRYCLCINFIAPLPWERQSPIHSFNDWISYKRKDPAPEYLRKDCMDIFKYEIKLW